MADLNLSVVGGQIEKWRYTPPGNGKRYHNFWILTKLQDQRITYGDSEVTLEDQKLFMTVRISDKQAQGKTLKGVLAALDHGASYFIAAGATINSFVKDETEQFRLHVGLGNVQLFHEPRHPENLVVLCGNVSQAMPGWLQVEERYLNPFKNEWSSRRVWVYTGSQMSIQTGQRIYIRGRLATKRADGMEMLHVVAEMIT